MSWLSEQSEISCQWLLDAFAQKLDSGRFMFTVGRLFDISGVSKTAGMADLVEEFRRGSVSVISVAPITGRIAAVTGVWNPEDPDLTFIVAPRMKFVTRELLEAVVEVFFIEQCEPRITLIREYLEIIYRLSVSESELISFAATSGSLTLHGTYVYPSRASQNAKRREFFAHYPRYENEDNSALLIDIRLRNLAEFFISHFAGKVFSAIQFAILVKLYGPEVFSDAPAGLALWFYDRAVSLGIIRSETGESSLPRVRVISVVPICVEVDQDDLPSPFAGARVEDISRTLVKEQLLFVHCFKHELLVGQSVLLNQVNNLCRVRSGVGAQINFKAFGFAKLRDFLEEIPGVKVSGDKHNMAVYIENIHAFASFIAEAKDTLGGDDASLMAGFETVDLPQLIPGEVLDKMRSIFLSRENREILGVELLTNFKTHFMPADPLVYKRLGYRRIKDFIAAVPNIKKLGSKGAAKYVWCD